MIGIIVISHGSIAKELVHAAEYIVGKQQYIKSIKILPNSAPKLLQNKLEKFLKEFQHCDGTLILTDMLGGTSCNICLPFTKTYNIKVVSGVNLYMLITALLSRDKISLTELADKVTESGRKNIIDVQEAIKPKT